MAKRRDSNSNGSAADGAQEELQFVSLSLETRRRYLNYALSVITARALPDVRDGLKPVQRRILYVMYEDLRVRSDSKTVKCAKITGNTTGNYHPHGDVAVYDALVRLAQDFTLRMPLVEGQGNFGSIIGLPPAAARYTEARLRPIAERLMDELRFNTVEMRPTYDAAREEPVVLPAKFPNILVNGSSGIAVGMATNIPPHNLGEVVRAAIQLIDNPDASVAQLMRSVKGPDFPLGGRIVTDKKELRDAYESGRGTIKIRGEWRLDQGRKRKEIPNRIVIYNIPFGIETGPLVASIGELVESRKLPQLVAVADESDEESGLRIVLELKSGSDPEAVMTYLYKHTTLEANFSFNLTCLVPDEHGATVPQRCSLKEILRYFLDFRFATVRRRFEHQLQVLERRIHILQGFMVIFNDLDLALEIIRGSSGKADAAEKLMGAFPLDELQTDAILELALYRISTLEVNRIRDELEDKEKQAERIRKILKSDKQLWSEVRTELDALAGEFADKRRTTIGSSEEIAEFDPSVYIVKENTNVVVSTDGWIKRLGKITTVDKLRVREGDAVLTVIPGSTLDNVAFFSSDGTAYTLPIDQVPASTGYGEPITKFFKLGDGVSLVTALPTDPRFVADEFKVRGEDVPGPHLCVLTAHGQIMRVGYAPFRTPSTRAGRRYCRLRKADRVVDVQFVEPDETIMIGTKDARVLHFPVSEVPILAGVGKGVRGIRLEGDDEVLGFERMRRPSDVLQAINENGKQLSFGQLKYTVASRGGKGIRTSKRTGFTSLVRSDIETVDWSEVKK